MRTFHPFPVKNIETFKQQLLQLSYSQQHFCYLDSNNYPNYPYSTFGSFFAIGAIDVLSENQNCLQKLDEFRERHQDWLFGFMSYDLKNEIEESLHSFNADTIGNPLLHFFIPKYLVKIENNAVEVGIHHECNTNEALSSFRELAEQSKVPVLQDVSEDPVLPEIHHRISKDRYIDAVERIRQHIQRGDIYEMNFCQEFYADHARIDALSVFKKLNQLSKAPFSSFFKNQHHYLLCASPERFLKRQHHKLISQPIKGTRKRVGDKLLDQDLQKELYLDEKERSENIMIVDLVRNDLSKIALKNSVKVEELFGIYTFEQVHQMISTVTCSIEAETNFTDIIRNVFPMGSMTGAPKMAAMRLIEKYETSRRGLYSGAVGYITPKGNFDFNVVIRSILYNAKREKISFQAGSAITIDCDPEKEYDECLLKANAMLKALS